MRKEWIAALIGTMAALVLAVGGTWAFTQPSQVEAAQMVQPVASENERLAVQDLAPASQLIEETVQTNHVAANRVFAAPRGNRGEQARPQGHGVRGGARGQIDHEALLADALGITVEQLEAAHESARQAGIQQALAEGLITQEQADQMLAREGRSHRGPRSLRGAGGKSGLQSAQIDRQALLADALGITVEQLDAAHQAARAAATQQAIDEGLITQEQADMKAAHEALKAYMDREAIMAQALGISVADLQAAREEDRSLRTLIEELGLDRETLQANMQAAHEAAIQQAVADGVITQAQAEQILEGKGRGVGGRHGRGAPGGKGHRQGEGRPDREFDRNNGGNIQNNTTIPANDA